LPVAQWFYPRAVEHGGFEVELVDLAEINLPFLDEPNQPRQRQYTHQHTKIWSAKVDSADAFVFVTPEYNYNMPATLLNALDCLYWEWHYKPAGFVSYAGMSGGLRSVQVAKLVMTTLKLVPLPEAVSIPFVTQLLVDGQIQATEGMERAATTMLNELLRWAEALRPLRAAPARAP
jgi:NAD(P)H-dependent FMN reductase